MATIRDIAQAAGVSPSTVTKALSGAAGVSDAKRALISRLARELGYRPNRAASSLARTHLRIGVLIPSEWPVYHEPIRRGILYALERLRDYLIESSVRYYRTDIPSPGRPELEALLGQNPDGILFCPGGLTDYRPLLTLAHDRGIPLGVVGDRTPDAPGLFTLEADAARCARTAAGFLSLCMPQGAHAAMLAGTLAIASHGEKAAAFRNAFPGRQIAVVESHDRDEEAYAAVKSLLQSKNRPSGLYIASSVAEGALEAVREHGDGLCVVATDVSAPTRAGLLDGTVGAIVDQTPFTQGMRAVYYLERWLSERQAPPKEILLTPRLYLAGNLPDSDEEVI